MKVATLSSKNQITIPREARQALGLRPGDRILIVVRRGHLILLREPESYSTALCGLGRGLYPAGYLEKERQSWD